MSLTFPTDKSFQFSIVSPERNIYSGEVRMVSATSVDGELGIYPQHAPLLANLAPGVVRVITLSGDEEYIYVSGGYIEIQPAIVTILADTAVRGLEVDENEAREAKQRAEEGIRTSVLYSDRDRAYIELIKALAQLKALEQSRRHKKRGI